MFILGRHLLEIGLTLIPFILKKQLDSDRFNEYLYTANTTNQFTNYGYAVQHLEDRARGMLKIDDSKAVIATSSGTTALYAIIYGMMRKDQHKYRVSTQAFTFPSNAIGAAEGAIIADMDNRCNIHLDNEYIVKNSDLVIATNIFGHLQDISKIISKTEHINKKLIFDNAATPYSFWNGTNTCNLGTASYISLHHTKPIGFGEGGLAIVDKEYEEMVRASCAFGIIDDLFNEYSGNYKMSELSAAGILQWWDQFSIDDIQNTYLKNYNKLRYEMRHEDGDFWINHTSDNWFPTCLPFIHNSPIEEVSGEFNSREYRKYYKPLAKGLPVSELMYNNIMCIALTEGVEKCINV